MKDNFEKFFNSPHAKVLGYIADMFGAIGGVVGLIALMTTIQLNDGTNNPKLLSLITPASTLFLWFIITYIYISILHQFWKNNTANNLTKDSFWKSLYLDFILKFKYPWHLLPLIILLILLIWILIKLASWSPLAGTILGLLMILMLVVSFYFFASQTDAFSKLERLEKKFERDVENNWEKWESRIRMELSFEDQIFLDCTNLADLIEPFDLMDWKLRFVYSKYASLHPNEVKYGRLLNAETNEYFGGILNYGLIKRNTTFSEPYIFT